MLLANFNRKEHLRHRAVSLRQHGFLVNIIDVCESRGGVNVVQQLDKQSSRGLSTPTAPLVSSHRGSTLRWMDIDKSLAFQCEWTIGTWQTDRQTEYLKSHAFPSVYSTINDIDPLLTKTCAKNNFALSFPVTLYLKFAFPVTSVRGHISAIFEVSTASTFRLRVNRITRDRRTDGRTDWVQRFMWPTTREGRRTKGLCECIIAARSDSIEEFNVDWKAECVQFKLAHVTKNLKNMNEETKK